MIYDIPLSLVEKLEQRISRFIRKWLGFHPTISSLALYSKESPCPLPFTSLSSLFKTSKTSSYLQLRDSKDPVISSSVPVVDTGRKWSVADSVDDAESILYFKKILGHTQTGKAGFGYTPVQKFPAKGSKEYRKAVSDTVSDLHGQAVLASQEGKKLQLNWTTWGNYVRNDLSWKCVWAFGPQLLQFCVQSCFNTLPSPNNLQRWKLSQDQSCPLCKKPCCTLPHVLSGCSFSLNNGRWTYRHDCVLKVFLEGLEEILAERKKCKDSVTPWVKFLPAGQSSQKKRKERKFGLLGKARDWVLLSDIGCTKMHFPSEIFVTSDRPDIVLYSTKTKTVILIENTSGCEENHSENHTLKTDKYFDLVEAIRGNGWTCHFFAVETGARGFNSTHVPFCLKSLGFSPKGVKEMLSNLSRASLKASYRIWLARDDKEWKPPSVDWKSSFGPSLTSPSVDPVKPVKSSIPAEDIPTEEESVDFSISSLPKPPSVSVSSVESDMPGRISQSNPTVFRRPGIGLYNMGNTCYANSVLNCLFPFKELWDFPSESLLHQSLKAMMVCLNSRPKNPRAARPHRPSVFLKSLASHISEKRSSPFRFKRQHDAVEILGYVLDEVDSARKKQKLVSQSSSFVKTIRCQVCLVSKVLTSEDEHIIAINVLDSVSSALTTMLSGDEVTRYCSTCQKDQVCTEQLSFSHHPDVLVFHLQRGQFDVRNGARRLAGSVVCDRQLSIGVGSEDVFVADYYLSSVVLFHLV